MKIAPDSSYCAFKQVRQDGHKTKGKRMFHYSYLLTLVLVGKLAGETKVSGIIKRVEKGRADPAQWKSESFGYTIPERGNGSHAIGFKRPIQQSLARRSTTCPDHSAENP